MCTIVIAVVKTTNAWFASRNCSFFGAPETGHQKRYMHETSVIIRQERHRHSSQRDCKTKKTSQAYSKSKVPIVLQNNFTNVEAKMQCEDAIGNVAVKVKDRHADNTGTDDDVLVAASSTNTGHLNIIFCKHSARGLIEIPNQNTYCKLSAQTSSDSGGICDAPRSRDVTAVQSFRGTR